ncbi:hypothetical protein HanRHA438_Chr06g0273691 [Helianthus annuus]|nr:hypothetical protein HanRHA438_Chr06g0273691 [Helianthus annuus]
MDCYSFFAMSKFLLINIQTRLLLLFCYVQSNPGTWSRIGT